jgi:hypothetical protein
VPTGAACATEVEPVSRCVVEGVEAASASKGHRASTIHRTVGRATEGAAAAFPEAQSLAVAKSRQTGALDQPALAATNEDRRRTGVTGGGARQAPGVGYDDGVLLEADGPSIHIG